MTVHGILIVAIASFLLAYLGWLIDEREGTKGAIGWALGAVSFLAGLAYLLGV